MDTVLGVSLGFTLNRGPIPLSPWPQTGRRSPGVTSRRWCQIWNGTCTGGKCLLLSSSASLEQGRGSLSLRSLGLQWHQPCQFEVWNRQGMGGGNGDQSGEAKQIRTTQNTLTFSGMSLRAGVSYQCQAIRSKTWRKPM